MREDFEQIGYIGLIKACKRFDSSKGSAFSTFAWAYIEGEIRDYKRDKLTLVKLPRETRLRMLKNGESPFELHQLQDHHIIEEIDENRQLLRLEIEDLPKSQQLIVVGIYFEGKTSEEIAKQLNVSRPTISRWKNKAIATLRSKLDSNRP